MSPRSPDPHRRRRAWPDRAIAAVAARQATMIDTAQLAQIGVDTRAAAAAHRRGRLYRVHRGVYSLVPAAARPRWAPEWAALLACGPSAMLSHQSAARLHGFDIAQPSIVELTLSGVDRGRTRSGMEVHLAGAVHPSERVRIGRMPASAPARLAIEIGPRLSDLGLARLVDEVIRKSSRARLHEALERHEPGRGTRRVRAMLDPARPSLDSWSQAEARLLARLRRAGVETPATNEWVGRFRPDLLWRRQRVIVEFDSLEHHRGPGSFTSDRWRGNELATRGYQVLHVTWEMLTEHPDQILVWVVTMLARAE